MSGRVLVFRRREIELQQLAGPSHEQTDEPSNGRRFSTSYLARHRLRDAADSTSNEDRLHSAINEAMHGQRRCCCSASNSSAATAILLTY